MFIFLVFPCNSDSQMILYSIIYAKNFRKRSIREICYFLVKYIEKGRDLERICFHLASIFHLSAIKLIEWEMGLTFVLGNEWEKCFWSRHEHGTQENLRAPLEEWNFRPLCSNTKPLAHHNEFRRIHIEVRNKDPQIHFKQLQKVHERAWPQLLLVNLIYMWNTREKRLRSMSKVWSHAHSVSSIFCLVLKPACEKRVLTLRSLARFRGLTTICDWAWTSWNFNLGPFDHTCKYDFLYKKK